MLTVYSKNQCGFCDAAIKLLESKGVAYEVIKIDENSDAREFVLGEGHRSVPQIYKDGKLFVAGGFNGLKSLSDEQLKGA